MTQTATGPFLRILGSAAISAALFASSSTARAEEDVAIRSLDGGISLTGRMLGFDGTYLRLDTAQGEVTLDYALVSCIGAACPDPATFVETLRFSGTGRLGGLILPALVEGYARLHDMTAERTDETLSRYRYELTDGDGRARATFTFRLTTTEDGFADLIAREADIVMADRPIRPQEAGLAQGAGLGQMDGPTRLRILASDAVVPIASPGLAIRDISLEDLARAFSGEVTNWSEIGGDDRPISLHLGDPDTGLTQGFVQIVLSESGRDLSPAAARHPGDLAVIAAVTETDGGLGVVSFEQTGNATVLGLRGECGLRIAADLTTVRTGDYPLTMPLFLYHPARRLGPAGRDFLDWLATAEAQLILRRIGVPGQEPVPIPLSQQGDRLAMAIALAGQEVGLDALQRMVRTMDGYDRLSPTFRFESGQSQLDPASRSQVRSLAQAIRDGGYAGQDLVLMGFSDGAGPALANRRLSATRAASVREAVLTLLSGELPEGVGLRSIGMGEALPIGCDDTLWGQQMNRRVELWAPRGALR